MRYEDGNYDIGFSFFKVYKIDADSFSFCCFIVVTVGLFCSFSLFFYSRIKV